MPNLRVGKPIRNFNAIPVALLARMPCSICKVATIRSVEVPRRSIALV
jgi:hypothetical protein